MRWESRAFLLQWRCGYGYTAMVERISEKGVQGWEPVTILQGPTIEVAPGGSNRTGYAWVLFKRPAPDQWIAWAAEKPPAGLVVLILEPLGHRGHRPGMHDIHRAHVDEKGALVKHEQCGHYEDGRELQPTHWMPVPPLPPGFE